MQTAPTGYGVARDRPSPYVAARFQTAPTGHGAQDARLQTAPTGYGVARDRPAPYESFPRMRGCKPRLPAMELS
ncbi:hypothetical protein C6495_03030 [Candidatus Poribacteria bacterium]|nr:MAG: hypothetical protein C6495_03030 [Candidatus Poribacteria bacterium]